MIKHQGAVFPPFPLPKLSEVRSRFTIPKFDKACRRCEKKLVKSERPFADLICPDCLAAWVEVESILDTHARGKMSDPARAEKLWGGLFNDK